MASDGYFHEKIALQHDGTNSYFLNAKNIQKEESNQGVLRESEKKTSGKSGKCDKIE